MDYEHAIAENNIYLYQNACKKCLFSNYFSNFQLILVNPLCIPAYAVVSWMFFNSRIYIEEITLLNFFGQNYVDYQRKVPTGVPYVKGYQIWTDALCGV